MTPPVITPQSTSSQPAEITGSQAAQGRNKRSAPNVITPNYSAEILQAAPTLNAGLQKNDQVSERPRKMQRRGAMPLVSQTSDTKIQPTQSGIARATDDLADLFAGSKMTDKEPKKS